MDVSNIKDIAGIVQSCAVTIAAIIGSVWAVFVFRVKKEKEKAAKELHELEKRLLPKSDEIALLSAYSTSSEDGCFYIFADVELKNKGNIDVRLNFNERTLAVAALTSSNDIFKITSTKYCGVVRFEDPNLTKLWNQPYSLLSAGSEGRLSFCIPVSNQGVYLVEFRAGVIGEKEATDRVYEAGGENHHNFPIKDYKLIFVQ